MPGNLPVAKLKVMFQEKVLSVWEFPQGASRIIGRGDEVHYQIKSEILSRRHCEIKDTGSALEVTDLNSLNGVLVNNQKISKTILKDGDEIRLGPVLIYIESLYPKPDEAGNRGETSSLPQPQATSIPTPASLQNIYPPLWVPPLPVESCIKCNRKISLEELSAHQAVFSKEKVFCISCFCSGAGDFPTIAGYRLVKKIGKGGMGDVYEAIQLSMERPVAIKVMKGFQAVNEEQRKRFLRESRIGGKFNHPNIVGFIDAGEFENTYFITMEYIYGKDVKRLLKEMGHIPYQEALRIAYYIASALDYASNRYHTIHRDIKPGNILVDRDYIIKLTDFGLSKNLEEAGLSDITKPKTGLGTVFYMAPEQISNACGVDHRVDVYALGITIYEMIAGTRPFEGEHLVTVANKIMTEAPIPITEIMPDIPREVWDIIAKSIEKKPEHRYQTAKEMKEILYSFICTGQKMATL